MRTKGFMICGLMFLLIFAETPCSFGQSVHNNTNDTLISFSNWGEKIFGMLHRPAVASDTLTPGIILLPDFTGNSIERHRLFVTTSRSLTQKGFYVLRFDYRGTGQSEGDFSDMTYRGELADAYAAISFLGSQARVDSNKIGILGFGLGGSFACHIAGSHPNVKSLILWAPLIKTNDLAEDLARAMLDLDNELIIGYVDWKGNQVGPKFMKQLSDEKPVLDLLNYTGQTLIIHGEKDEIIPVDDSRTLLSILEEQQKQAALNVITGANHSFDSVNWETEVVHDTVNWFENTLK